MAIAKVHIIIIKTNILQESRPPSNQNVSLCLMINSRIIDSVTVQKSEAIPMIDQQTF